MSALLLAEPTWLWPIRALRVEIGAVTEVASSASKSATGRGEADEARWSRWMASAQQGDADAYRQLLEELSGVIEAYLRKNFGDAPLIEDCVQEGLLAIHRARASYDPRRSFRPWMFTVVRHKAIDVLRGRTRRSQREVAVEEPDALPAQEGQEDARIDATKLLDGLSAPYREALVLTKLEGRSLKEAADRAGVSETAMKSRVHRAIRLVQKAWQHEPI